MLIDFSMIGGLIDRREQPAALEVVGDHLRDADADFGIAGRAGDEVRDRDRYRRELALRNRDHASAPAPKRCERLPVSAPSAAIPEIICRRFGRNVIARQTISVGHCFNLANFVSPISAEPRHVASGLSFREHRREIFPFLEERRRQLVRLAFDDRPQRALLIDAQVGRRRRRLPAPARPSRVPSRFRLDRKRRPRSAATRCRHRASSSSARPAA